MLGGAPEAHEVLSKTPRIGVIPTRSILPEAFPIKASDNPEVIADALVLKIDVLHEICHIVPSAFTPVLAKLPGARPVKASCRRLTL